MTPTNQKTNNGRANNPECEVVLAVNAGNTHQRPVIGPVVLPVIDDGDVKRGGFQGAKEHNGCKENFHGSARVSHSLCQLNAVRTFLLACLLLVVSTLYTQADVIPADRRYDWVPGVTVGVPGGIPLAGMTEWTNIVTAGAVGDGVTDNTALLSALFNACPSNKYIYAPAGRYRTATTIGLSSGTGGWALVGAGTNTVFTNSVGFVSADFNSFGAPFRLHGTHAKGVTNLTTAGQDMSSYLRKTIRLSRSEAYVPDPDIQVQDIYFTDRILRQLVVVETVSDGTNFTINRPTMWELAAAYDPWVEVNSSVYERVGFANFTVEGSGSTSAFSVFGCRFFWWQKVKSVQNSGYFLNDVNNLQFEGRDCYATCIAVGSGSALFLFTGSSGHWFPNNYGINGSPFFEINGTSTCVFDHNYATNSASDPNLGAGSYVGNPYNSHGAHAMMNLLEANKGTMLQAPDAYFGSASHWTLFRNNFTGYDPARSYLPRAVDVNRWGTYFNFVGNALGATNVTGWYYNMTNDAYEGAVSDLPTIYTFGYTAPGHRNYNQFNNGAHWKYPGFQNRIGPATNTFTIPTNRIAGTFTNVTAGDHIILQSAANTNHYYPMNTNFPRLTVSSVSAAYLELSKDITYTNNSVVWKIGDGGFFNGLHYPMTFPTMLLHGNTDASNGFNVILWDTTGTVTDSNIPPSLIYGSTAPTWATNYSTGTALAWPYVNPTNAVVGDWAARSLWEDAPMAGVNPPVTNVFMRGVQTLQGVQSIQ